MALLQLVMMTVWVFAKLVCIIIQTLHTDLTQKPGSSDLGVFINVDG